MAAASSSAVTPKWVIDLHGIKDALTTTSNSAKNRVISAIQSGEMLIVRSVSNDLNNLYPHLWAAFTAIQPRKYVPTTVASNQSATLLQEQHGSGILGGLPLFEHFEAVAVARDKKCRLVSAGKALKSCKQIAKGCGIPDGDVTDITGV
ncbi:hypothetical protein [Sphingomonas mollis]|uniref:hypothetical protein n=1 Tax=Sphingomonas mollis TaxID=2795726 RepID=UPI001E4FF425|nr:hypothetical protein [Sphingomonas sp. BT553]